MTAHRPVCSHRQGLLGVPLARQCWLATPRGRAFSVGAPTLWNQLPLELRLAPDLHSFRHDLKTWFFQQVNDGKLSFDEFKAYFEDGILSIEELHQLFQKIDIHNTDVLSALEDLNVAILKAMDSTKKNYQEASTLEQFVTRFLLKETLNQLQSLHNSLECAMETTEEQTQQDPKEARGAQNTTSRKTFRSKAPEK
uniref:N-terminal EF-hand calcium binding protein 3 n=1 Tax=Naja naja TaxID=35670 RepID=A0A8C6VN49_NAJNA